MHPPNIHEIERILLLRQALDILEAPEDVQRGLYPEDRDPAFEMTALYRDAWHGVRRVFTPILPRAAIETLDGIDADLDGAPPDWDTIRRKAGDVRGVLPSVDRRGEPRAWPDQIVIGPNHLMVRRQLGDE
ncbi:MAG: hypothetical protein AAGC67_19890 [Myxococcota bacterium]